MRAREGGVCPLAKLPLLILLTVLALFTSCTEDKNPVGFDRSGRVIDSSAREIILQADSSYAKLASPVTGTSQSILVGAEEQTTMIGLLRFDAIPDTTGLSRAYLRIHLRRGRGTSVDLSLSRLKGLGSDWSASDVTWDTAPGADPNALSTLTRVPTSTIEPDSTDSAAFELPLDLLRFWKAQPDSNAGLQIACTRGTGTARIISHNDILYGTTYRIATPSIHLVYLDTDRVETIVLASGDAYVIDDRRPEPSKGDSTAWVTAGPASRFHLHFNLAPLFAPFPRASIVRATLILPVRTFDVIASDPMLLGTYAVTDEDGTLATTAAGLSNELTNPFAIEVGSLVQSWVDGATNNGVVVRATDEISTMEGILFYTSQIAADSLRPRLRILYVPPPEPRWPVTP
jgi:hypothetical protein